MNVLLESSIFCPENVETPIFDLRPRKMGRRSDRRRLQDEARTAGRRGGAGPRRTGRHQISSSRRQSSLVPAKASNTPVLNVISKARTSEMLYKLVEEQNPPWTRARSAMDLRFISGTKSALRSSLLVSEPAPLCRCKFFSCKTCSGIIGLFARGTMYRRLLLTLWTLSWQA